MSARLRLLLLAALFALASCDLNPQPDLPGNNPRPGLGGSGTTDNDPSKQAGSAGTSTTSLPGAANGGSAGSGINLSPGGSSPVISGEGGAATESPNPSSSGGEADGGAGGENEVGPK